MHVNWRRTVIGVFLVLAVCTSILQVENRASSTSNANLVYAGTHKGFELTFQYTCCSWKLVHTTYHPGDAITVKWIRVQDSSPPNEIMVISAEIVGPFSTTSALKHFTPDSASGPGLTSARSPDIQVLNTHPLRPISVIHIPQDAKTGYYDLVTRTVYKGSGDSGTGASVIHVVR
jgi:hypothetical protein